MNNLIELQEDDDTYEKVYRHSYPTCAGLVTTNGGSVDDAKDIFQEAMVILCTNIRKEHFVLSCSVEQYLSAVVIKMWKKELLNRKKAPISIVSEDDVFLPIIQENHPYEIIRQEETVDRVFDALEKMENTNCAKILKDFYFHKLPLKSIAEETGHTEKYLKKRKRQCLDALRIQLGFFIVE